MNPYKIQNRSDSSRRVKITKNGGSITFVTTPQDNYVENSREGGFCLLPIEPLPILDTSISSIALTSLPMGVDGRVSLYTNGILSKSVRYLGKNTVQARKDFFDTEFGTYASWVMQSDDTFVFSIAGTSDYLRFVFEDDDIDYLFNSFTQTPATSNPTLIVEQYRLSFDLKQSATISCDGALPYTNWIDLSGNWEVEIDGVLFNSEDNTVDDVVDALRSDNLFVGVRVENIPVEMTSLASDYNGTVYRMAREVGGDTWRVQKATYDPNGDGLLFDWATELDMFSIVGDVGYIGNFDARGLHLVSTNFDEVDNFYLSRYHSGDEPYTYENIEIYPLDSGRPYKQVSFASATMVTLGYDDTVTTWERIGNTWNRITSRVIPNIVDATMPNDGTFIFVTTSTVDNGIRTWEINAYINTDLVNPCPRDVSLDPWTVLDFPGILEEFVVTAETTFNALMYSIGPLQICVFKNGADNLVNRIMYIDSNNMMYNLKLLNPRTSGPGASSYYVGFNDDQYSIITFNLNQGIATASPLRPMGVRVLPTRSCVVVTDNVIAVQVEDMDAPGDSSIRMFSFDPESLGFTPITV